MYVWHMSGWCQNVNELECCPWREYAKKEKVLSGKTKKSQFNQFFIRLLTYPSQTGFAVDLSWNLFFFYPQDFYVFFLRSCFVYPCKQFYSFSFSYQSFCYQYMNAHNNKRMGMKKNINNNSRIAIKMKNYGPIVRQQCGTFNNSILDATSSRIHRITYIHVRCTCSFYITCIRTPFSEVLHKDSCCVKFLSTQQHAQHYAVIGAAIAAHAATWALIQIDKQINHFVDF